VEREEQTESAIREYFWGYTSKRVDGNLVQEGKASVPNVVPEGKTGIPQQWHSSRSSCFYCNV